MQKDARRTLHNAYTLGTFENLNTQWVMYLEFCIYFELVPFPASTILLVWYAQYLSRHLRAHGSIVSYLSGVKTLHTLLNYRIAGFHGFLLKLTLRGLRRGNPHIVKRARPMTPAILHDIHSTLNLQEPIDAIFWAISVLAFMLLFRKSNLVPNKINGFDGHRQLKHSDCVIEADGSKITIGIRWSKNHQFSRELLTFPLPALPFSVLCPVKAVRNVHRLVKWENNDHLFQLPEGGSFTYRRFQNMLRDKLKLISVAEASEYSSHSYRRGGTTFAFLCGVPIEMIKLLGNWSSDTFLSYLEFPIETRSAACELIKMRLRALESRQAG